jgi:hypothetical protein
METAGVSETLGRTTTLHNVTFEKTAVQSVSLKYLQLVQLFQLLEVFR